MNETFFMTICTVVSSLLGILFGWKLGGWVYNWRHPRPDPNTLNRRRP